MKKIVTFGEIMVRVIPDGLYRFRQALPGSVKMTFGGAEANVAASIAYLGGDASFVTALPCNDIAEACVAQLKMIGVDVSDILFTHKGRMGVYYTETGVNQRPGRVIYDRDYSSLSITQEEEYNWKKIFDGAAWFHITGITPALSACSAKTAVSAVRQAKKHNLTISCDLNYRSRLWQWDRTLSTNELAKKIMSQILPYVDVLIANEEDVQAVLGIQAKNTNVHQGKLDVEQYQDVCVKLLNMFPGITKMATTFRESISAGHNKWGAMLFDCPSHTFYYAPLENGTYSPYQITHIVDRVGGGDSFAAGLIFALNHPDLCSCENAVSFAVAASCLAHSIAGDYNYNKYEEVLTLMNGSASGRVIR